jgi:hypothetical protein
LINTPNFYEFSEKEWDSIREESFKTGEAMQFIAKRRKEKQKVLSNF